VNALTTLDYPSVARQKRGMIIAALRDVLGIPSLESKNSETSQVIFSS
jgi:hypothetical protein